MRGSGIVACCVCFWLAGCASNRLGRVEPIHEPSTLIGPRGAEIESAARERLASLYPAEASLAHRAILSARGTDQDLNGRLAISRGRGARLVAMLSAGQVVFDARVSPEGEGRAMREPLGLRREWVEREAARDLYALFVSPARDDYTFGLLSDGRAALWRSEPGGRELRHLFSADATRWLGAEIARKGKRLWRAECAKEAALKGNERPIPAAIEIEAPTYRLSLRALELKAGPQASKLFDAAGAREAK